jgi:hypothetical protein
LEARLRDQGLGARPAPAGPRHAAASSLEEAHEGHAVLAREVFGVDALAQPRRRGRAPALGEVLSAHDARAPVDAPEAHHVVGGHEAGGAVSVGLLGVAGDGALLAEAPRVHEVLDALADGAAALLALARHGLGAAVLARQGPASLDLLDLGLPAHAVPGSLARHQGQ